MRHDDAENIHQEDFENIIVPTYSLRAVLILVSGNVNNIPPLWQLNCLLF